MTKPVFWLSEVITMVLYFMMAHSAYTQANSCSIQVIAPSDSALALAGYGSSRNSEKTEIFVNFPRRVNEGISFNGTSKNLALKLSLGFGFPELVYTGVQGYQNTFQFGAGAGTLPDYDRPIFSAFLQGGYHFAGKTQNDLIPPWYAKVVLCYGYEESSAAIWQSVFLSPRIGRNFYFSKKAGIDLEILLSAELWTKKVEKNPSYWNFDFDFHYVPTISFCLFYLSGK